MVLDGVDLEIEAGSFVAVLGHNGSGKSTLAKHLNAILLPTGGKVYVMVAATPSSGVFSFSASSSFALLDGVGDGEADASGVGLGSGAFST